MSAARAFSRPPARSVAGVDLLQFDFEGAGTTAVVTAPPRPLSRAASLRRKLARWLEQPL